VYVGDGVWDARACRSVGIPFIGIGTGSRVTRLSAEGAVCVFSDFSDVDIFLKTVRSRTRPNTMLDE
jgi:phosphoglycolate phosphatase-like HAD superfamily hydrolase